MALNIQRARDHGLGDYNTAREEYKLHRITKWTEINRDLAAEKPEVTFYSCSKKLQAANTVGFTVKTKPTYFLSLLDFFSQVFEALKTLYKDDLTNVDIWVGGLLETTEKGPGPLFRAIIKDQFNRIRNGDRFWYENYKLNG